MSKAFIGRMVLIIGAGPAGLSAAIYLGRSRRRTILIHSGRSMAKWEKDVQNYLGFHSASTVKISWRGGWNKRGDSTWRSLRTRLNPSNGITMASNCAALQPSIGVGASFLRPASRICPPEIEGVRECLGVGQCGWIEPSGFAVEQVIELAGYRVALYHRPYERGRLTRDGASFLRRTNPAVCVYGHTHQPKSEWREGVLPFNPGSAGPNRFHLPRALG